MLLAAKKLAVTPQKCIVIEDAVAGIKAARSAGMKSIGIGDKDLLSEADYVFKSTEQINSEQLLKL